MKKFIVFVVIIVSLIGYGLYNKEQLTIWFAMNDHQQAASQYWFSNKHALDDTGTTNLPFRPNVQTFGYSISDPVEQDGKYYFETNLYINNQQHLPLFTVVEPIDGVWTVNQEATFATAGDASINFYTERYIATMKSAGKYIDQSIPQMEKEQLEKFVDKQLIAIKAVLIETYSK